MFFILDFAQSSFDRPVPNGMELDVPGLIESWVMQAEDWLTAYAGCENVTPEEAFEGIEIYGRLNRCQRSLIDAVDPDKTLNQLQGILIKDANLFFKQGSQYLDLSDWLATADSGWDAEDDDPQLSQALLMELDAVELVEWFGEMYADTQLQLTNPALATNLLKCQLWFEKHLEFFSDIEPLVRAIGKGIDQMQINSDETALLSLSVRKFINLMDQAEWLERQLSGTGDLKLILSQRPLGREKMDYEPFKIAVSAEGASLESPTTQTPFRWRSPDGSFEAITFLPEPTSEDHHEIEVIFGTGRDFADPARELVGQTVQLGGATATIQTRQQGTFDLIFARLQPQQIVQTEGNLIELRLGDQLWI